MSKDIIYRKDAIAACDVLPKLYGEAIKLFIRDLPSADRPQGWIPCSEKLPEDNERVLVTTAWGYVTIGWIKQNIWSTDLIVNLRDFVLAWMPLPKPWKGEDDE